jgi:hypothetical protein
MSNAVDPLSLPPEKRDVVCVLGGRSGTSLVARLVNILGVDLGPPEQLMAANAANEKGFFEHTKFVAINDEILARYGAKWPKMVMLPEGWENSPKHDDLRDRALKQIRADFVNSPLWGWKDPRTCATLPFWRRLIPNMRFVICMRNPIDTARSNAQSLKAVIKDARWNWLESMQDTLVQSGVASWIEFIYLMLHHTQGWPRMTLLYEDVMDDTEGEVRRIARFIGRPEGGTDPAILQQVREFKSDKLRHHNTSLGEVLAHPDLPLVAKSVFLSLRTRATLERQSQRAIERGEADPKLEEAMPLDALDKLAEEAMKWKAAAEAHLTQAGAAAQAPPVESPQDTLAKHIHRVVAQHTPSGAKIAVVSHGDEAMLSLDGRSATHFPQRDDGGYIGYHPADSAAAIAHLADAQKRGAAFLLFPQPQLWWLGHYKQLGAHLDSTGQCLWRDEMCAIYSLAPDRATPEFLLREELNRLRKTADEQSQQNQSLKATLDAIRRRWEARVGAGGEDQKGSQPRTLPFDVAKLKQFADVQPVFILGASRTGTTAVAGALEKSLNAFRFLEGHLFHLLPPMLSGIKSSWDNLRCGEGEKDYVRGQDRVDIYQTLNDVITAFNSVYATSAAAAGRSRWLDKTPSHETILAVPILAHMYPQAKFIFMHRHPIKRAISFLKKFENFPEATMQSAIIGWEAAMHFWPQVRGGLREGAWIEIAQPDLQLKTDDVIESLTTLLSLTPQQAQAARNYLLSERPESTASSEDAAEITLDDLDWPAEFKAWCRQTCEATASAWGYRLDRSAVAAGA